MWDGDLESEFKETGNKYSKHYETWRKKEELNHLKKKYEKSLNDSSSSSSDEDDEGAEITEEIEKDFFKTLSYLKKKDPKIYDNSVNFFNSRHENLRKEKKRKEEPMYIKDYERKFLLKNEGVLTDEETDINKRPRSPTYIEEQNHIKEKFKKVLENVSDDEDKNESAGLWKPREKNKEESEKDEAEYKKWLSGQTGEIKDAGIKSELKPLKDFWNDPNLDDGEKFLRDYILDKKYLDKEGGDYIPTYEEVIHDSDSSLSGDEKVIQEQEEFEHKYNFRFQEPDQEFIKRFPRTIQQSVRKTDDSRKIKRAETKARKQQEKREKMAEIQKLRELKRKEVEDKIEKLKEITGNTDVGFKEDDIDGDFDPEAHDRRMRALFNDDFYGGGEDQRPEFPKIGNDLEIENWEHWNEEENNEQDDFNYEPYCEDENFIMDADYDPSTSAKGVLAENTKDRKRRRKKSKVAEALSRAKPKYDPNEKSYEKYFDEYYKLECEDIIDDIPCRFKYREVIPNDFGLSIEEILLAKDSELNRWCSLKKAVQYRPANVEKYDQIVYSKKGKNVNLKKKILPSLFSEEPEKDQNLREPSQNSENKSKINVEPNISKTGMDLSIEPIFRSTETLTTEKSEIKSDRKKTKKKNKKKKKTNAGYSSEAMSSTVNNQNEKEVKSVNFDKTTNKDSKIEGNDEQNLKKRKRKFVESNKTRAKKLKNNSVDPGISDARLSAYGINPKKFKNKLKYGNKN